MKSIINWIIIICAGLFVSCYDRNNVNSPLQISENSSEELYYPEFMYETTTLTNDASKVGYRNNFIGIINKLNLDSTQIIKVNQLMFKHQECVKSCISSFKEKEKAILDSAKVQYREIRFNVSSGVLSKEEAKVILKELNAKTRESIQNLEKTLNVKRCLSECDEIFTKSLLGILTPEQTRKFNELIKQRRGPGGNVKRDTIDIKKDSIRIKKDSIDIKRDTTNRKRKIG